MKRNDPVSALKGAGEKTAQALGKAGVYTIEDLLRFFPVRYERFDPPVTIAEAPSGKVCTLRGTFSSQPQSRRTGSMIVTTISLRDDTGLCRLTWFRMPYLARTLKKGDHCLVRGRFSRGPYGIVMEQPRLYGEEEYAALQATLQPVYPQAGKLSAKQIGKLLHQTFL